MGWRDRLNGLPRPEPFELTEAATLVLLSPFVLAPAPVEALAARAVVAWQFREGAWTRNRRLVKFPPELAAHWPSSALAIARASEADSMQERIRLLRGAVFPWWRRRLRLIGLGHVRAGLEGGNGVILWVQRCTQSNVAVKQALWQAGYPLAHLSRPGHPFSGRPFGMRWINPLLRRAELRFLAERVVIEGSTIPALRRLRALLAENRVVSITVAPEATRREEMALLGGWLALPHGPVQLAVASGAALLPVFTYGREDRTYVEIGAPLPVTGPGRDEVRGTLTASRDWLERRVTEHPEAWIGWRTREYRSDGEGAAAEPLAFDSGG